MKHLKKRLYLLCAVLLLVGSLAFGEVTSGSILLLDGGYYAEGFDLSQVEFYSYADTTVADINGAYITSVWPHESSIVNLNSGYVAIYNSVNSPTINVYGGTLRSLFQTDSSVANLYGGQILNIMSFESSIVNVYGYDMEYIPLEEPIASEIGGGPVNGFLTGFWRDGTAFSIELSDWRLVDGPMDNPITYDHINLITIPEPGTVLLFGLGGMVLGRRRRG